MFAQGMPMAKVEMTYSGYISNLPSPFHFELFTSKLLGESFRDKKIARQSLTGRFINFIGRNNNHQPSVAINNNEY
jgi:hypothetical protein